MGEVRVRAATGQDAAGIGRVHVRSWQRAYRGLMPDDLLDRLDPAARGERWREIIASLLPGACVLVAVDADTVIGFASGGENRDEPGVGEVYAIYVDPERWGTGAGWALMDRLVECLTAGGPRPIRLWALDGNQRAQRFYERYGFVVDGATGTHPIGDLTVPTIRFALPAAG